jgi:hypothetical protein
MADKAWYAYLSFLVLLVFKEQPFKCVWRKWNEV